jgi:hypothetical protein
MRYTFLLLTLSGILLSGLSYGQYYQTGQDPASIRWNQIKTGKYTIIYPQSFGENGEEFARSVARSRERINNLFTERRSRIPIVLHSFSSLSNGYVSWSPRRMEMYPSPDQNAIPGNQFDLLNIHELTHVGEMEALNKGFTHVMNIFLGEQFTGAISSMLPLWYLEGNAVFSESLLTSSGRGRSPSFQKQIKAVITGSDQYYKYDKILNGSFRDFVPDHYQSGYYMTTWAILKHDPKIWNKVLSFTGEVPFTVNPVNISLRKNIGLTKRELFREAFDTLRSEWMKNSVNSLTYTILNRDKRGDYVNYYSPVITGDSLLAVKTSLSESTRIIIIDRSGREKVLHNTGYLYPYLISYGGNKIVWIESRPDPRWENRDYSIIRVLDIKKGNVHNLSFHTRYMAASISADGNKVAAIENTADNKNNLIILDSQTGNILKTISSPANTYIQRPRWSDDNERITVLYVDDNGEGIMAFSPASGKWETLIKSDKSDLQSAFLNKDNLYYVSSANGIDNIYEKTAEGLSRLTSSRYGVSDPVIRGDSIIFSDYGRDGNSICISSLEEKVNLKEAVTARYLIDKFEEIPEDSRIPSEETEFKVEPYRKWEHMFRFHSWMPFYADIKEFQADPGSIKPGFTIMSQNTLSTLITTLGYEYREGYNAFHSSISWQGQYPVYRTQIDYGFIPDIVGNPFNYTSGFRFSNEISVPLNFSRGYMCQYIMPALSIDYSNNVYTTASGNDDAGQTSITARLYISNSSRSALRDIHPKWAQTIDLNYLSHPFDNILGPTAFLKTSFYFPGLFRNNSLRLRFESENQKHTRYVFRNRISFPRGFSSVAYPTGYHNIISDELNLISAEYAFPFAYPDFNISSLLYLKRLRGNLFYDYASGRGNRYYTFSDDNVKIKLNQGTDTFKSFGFEALADFHIFRIPFMISGGVQTAWKDFTHGPVFNVLFNIDLYGFSIGQP